MPAIQELAEVAAILLPHLSVESGFHCVSDPVPSRRRLANQSGHPAQCAIGTVVQHVGAESLRGADILRVHPPRVALITPIEKGGLAAEESGCRIECNDKIGF